MFKKIILTTLALPAVTYANFYLGGGINHHNNTFQLKYDDEDYGFITNEHQITPPAIFINAGTLNQESYLIYGVDLGVNFNFSKVELGDYTSIKSPMNISLVGKLGAAINSETFLYGNLGLGLTRIEYNYRSISDDHISDSGYTKDLILGFGVETKISTIKNLSIFAEYNLNIPFSKYSFTDDGNTETRIGNNSRVFKVGGRYYF